MPIVSLVQLHTVTNNLANVASTKALEGFWEKPSFWMIVGVASIEQLRRLTNL